jgi:hypothetical protein
MSFLAKVAGVPNELDVPALVDKFERLVRAVERLVELEEAKQSDAE